MAKRFTPTTTEVSDMVKLYEDGKTLAIVATTFHVSVPTIRRSLLNAGVTIRPRGRRTKDVEVRETQLAFDGHGIQIPRHTF